MKEIVSYYNNGSIIFDGIIKKINDFVNSKQLKNENLWISFVNAFKNKEDSDDAFWKCEFWGKMMRGASLCYAYQKDEELYRELEKTIRDMLSAQDGLGRFSSYRVNQEFRGWDVWGRKYVLTGMLHFLKICKDNILKQQIIEALKKHVDYLVDHIGKNKIKITSTSTFWLGVNSASILEPIVNFYEVTKEKKYLDFAKYIIDEGGISDGNLIDVVKQHKLLPYQYPEAKAYETMSFFEGVYRYALVTNDNELKNIALTFFEDVQNSEISVTGNAGSDEENFSNAAVNQVNKQNKEKQFIQETCVVVTYMRILSLLYKTTGDIKYLNRFETSCLNGFISSINFNNQSARDYYKKVLLPPLPFDSYSPLFNDRRGYSTGGLQTLSDGTSYGCCACIGSAGVGLASLNIVTFRKEDIYVNEYFKGNILVNNVSININEDFYINDEVKILINNPDKKNIFFRIPLWGNVKIFNNNNEEIKLNIADGYFKLPDGLNEFTIKFNSILNKKEINHKIYYQYGPFVLGIDEESNHDLDLDTLKADDISDLFKINPIAGSLVTFKANYKNTTIYFKDYASLGKHWDQKKNRLTVFIGR